MKAIATFCAIVGLVFLASCSTTANRTSALRLGMTRDEAIAVMGQPDSVSAQGYTEFLNYTLPESMGISSLIRPYYVRLVSGRVDAFGYSGQVDLGPRSSITTTMAQSTVIAATDGLRILSVEPPALVPGQTQEVKIKVRYALQSMTQAEVKLLFNTIAPSSYRVFDRHPVSSGTGELEMKAMLVPADWGDTTSFKVSVVLSPSTIGPGTRSLAGDQRVIDLKK